MGIVEKIKDFQQRKASEEAAKEILARAKAEQQAEKERQLQQANLQKTKKILEESGVTASLVEIKDKLTRSGLFGLRKGKLKHIEPDSFFEEGEIFPLEVSPFKNSATYKAIGGVELTWDERSFPSQRTPNRFDHEWKAIRVFVTEEGSLLLKRYNTASGRIIFVEIAQEDWERDQNPVVEALADSYVNPLKKVRSAPWVDQGYVHPPTITFTSF